MSKQGPEFTLEDRGLGFMPVDDCTRCSVVLGHCGLASNDGLHTVCSNIVLLPGWFNGVKTRWARLGRNSGVTPISQRASPLGPPESWLIYIHLLLYNTHMSNQQLEVRNGHAGNGKLLGNWSQMRIMPNNHRNLVDGWLLTRPGADWVTLDKTRGRLIPPGSSPKPSVATESRQRSSLGSGFGKMGWNSNKNKICFMFRCQIHLPCGVNNNVTGRLPARLVKALSH